MDCQLNSFHFQLISYPFQSNSFPLQSNPFPPQMSSSLYLILVHGSICYQSWDDCPPLESPHASSLKLDEVSLIKNNLLSKLFDNNVSMLRNFCDLDVCWGLFLDFSDIVDIIFILNFEVWDGVQVCTSCRIWKMLKLYMLPLSLRSASIQPRLGFQKFTHWMRPAWVQLEPLCHNDALFGRTRTLLRVLALMVPNVRFFTDLLPLK